MRKTILVFFILTTTLIAHGTDYSNIDKQSLTVPPNMQSANDIANYLTRNLTSQTDKVRAIFYWISHNIRYDISMLNSKKNYDSTAEIINEVLSRRQGVCQHYAELFKICCTSVGIRSFVVSGYTNQKGEMGNYGHAWNVVVIDNKYYLVDATWAAGYLLNGKYKHEFNNLYFLDLPASFIKTHIPYDPIWQLSNNPLTHKDFANSDFSKLKTSSDFNYKDSINKQLSLNQLQAAVSINNRIRKYGITNSLIQKELSHNQQLIITLKFNNAVELFNKAIADYNTYIEYKNKRFQNTKMPETEIQKILLSCRQQTESAEEMIRFLGSEMSDVEKLRNNMQHSIQKLKTDINKEELFLNKYIQTLKPFRIFLF